MPKLTIQIAKPKQTPHFPIKHLADVTLHCDAQTASRLRQICKAAAAHLTQDAVVDCFLRSLSRLDPSEALVPFYGAHVPRMTNHLPLATKILKTILQNGATLPSSLPLVNAVVYHQTEATPLLLATNVPSHYIDEALFMATQYQRRLAIKHLLASNCSNRRT